MIAKRFSARMLSPSRSNGPSGGPAISTSSISTAPGKASRGTSSVVASILKTVNLSCELGGGIRNEQTIRELLDLGLCRLVIGTLAIRQPDWFRSVCRQFPQRLVLGIDARDGKVATDGWLQTSDMAATELARQFSSEPLAAIIYTDIATDGMLAGPNVAAMAEMQAAVDLPVVASGGVTTSADVARLAAVGHGRMHHRPGTLRRNHYLARRACRRRAELKRSWQRQRTVPTNGQLTAALLSFDN